MGQLGHEPHCTNDAYGIFAVAHGRVANHAHDVFARITDTVVIINHHLCRWVVVHGVDSEIAPRRVFLHGAPHVVTQHPARGVNGVRCSGQLVLAGALVATDLLRISAV